MDQPTKPARTSTEILEAMIGQQAGLIARLQSIVERMPALQAEIDELRATLADLTRPEAPET
jgi:prefoldin subunit 5